MSDPHAERPAGGAGDEGAPFRDGDVVAGRYRIRGVLGSGGMGMVMAAVPLDGGEPVALKFLRAHDDRAAVDRFLREARASSRLRNDHVARVLDVGHLESGTPFLVMELLDGRTLQAVLAEGKALPVDEVCDYALQACEAVADAHAHGIVHRDLKPANMFVTRRADGRPHLKVLDFGISKIYAARAAGLTTTGAFLGSPSYAAPEQLIDPKSVDVRADVWGLGVCLYQLAADELPFRGDNPIQVCMLVLNSTPTPVQERRPALPGPLADAITRCLQKDPADRFSSVAELARALEPFSSAALRGTADRIDAMLAAASSRVGARDVALPPEPPVPTAKESIPPEVTHRPAQGTGSPSWLLSRRAAAGLGVLVVASTLALWAVRPSAAPPSSPALPVLEAIPPPPPAVMTSESAQAPASATAAAVVSPATPAAPGPVVSPATPSAPAPVRPPPSASLATTSSQAAAQPRPPPREPSPPKRDPRSYR